MDRSIESFENDGFKVKAKAIKAENKKIPTEVVQKPVQPSIKHIAVMENQGVLAETQKSNRVMQLAVAEIVRSLKSINHKPKELLCHNIERDSRGLMTSFSIKVVE